jgi:uncharacterized protein YbjT (DUF2867 family)
MRILVTGGTGVVGNGAIPELLAAGHTVRLLSRSASRQSNEWPAGVESIDGDVTDPDSIRGTADDCDVVLHVTGIVDEHPPEVTFERVNVEGTRNMLSEAERAGVRRFVFVSSLGADRGKSAYHVSKRQAEQLVSAYQGEWVVVRPGHVFGPGDEMMSMVLKFVRASPFVPQVGAGQHRFQPLWFVDAGRALAACVSRPDVAGKTLEIAGDEVLSVSDLLKRLSQLTERPAFPLPVPAFVVRSASRCLMFLKRIFHLPGTLPMNESKLTMLLEENVIADGENALVEVLQIKPTSLDEALRQLADLIPENPPGTGVGKLERKKFWIDLAGCDVDAAGLMTQFKTRITEVMPIDFSAEPDAPRQIEHGCTLSAHLPGRGHIQVRVEQCDDDRVTFVTIEGHPLAGAVVFQAERQGDATRFSVETFAQPSNSLDWIAIQAAGRWFQDLTWKQVVENMGRISGGESSKGVELEAETLDGDGTRAVEQWAEEMIARRKRGERQAELAARS